MHKRSQSGIYLILGVVVLIFLIVISFMKQQQIDLDNDSFILVNEKKALDDYIAGCLEDSSRKAMQNTNFLSESLLEDRIELELDICIASVLKAYQEKGITTSRGDMDIDVQSTDEAVVISLLCPILISKGDQQAELSEFNYHLARELNTVLPIIDGLVSETVNIFSDDGHLQLTIPEGTNASYNGYPLNTIRMRFKPKTDANRGVAGFIIYDMKPDNASFSGSGIQIRIDYGDFEFPPDFDQEQDLSISYFDAADKRYVALPSYDDKKNKLVYANTTHFTDFAPSTDDPGLIQCFGIGDMMINLETKWTCVENESDVYTRFEDYCIDNDHVLKHYCYYDASTGDRRCAQTRYSCSEYEIGSTCIEGRCIS